MAVKHPFTVEELNSCSVFIFNWDSCNNMCSTPVFSLAAVSLVTAERRRFCAVHWHCGVVSLHTLWLCVLLSEQAIWVCVCLCVLVSMRVPYSWEFPIDSPGDQVVVNPGPDSLCLSVCGRSALIHTSRLLCNENSMFTDSLPRNSSWAGGAYFYNWHIFFLPLSLFLYVSCSGASTLQMVSLLISTNIIAQSVIFPFLLKASLV